MVLPEPPAVSAYSWQFHSREAGQRGEVQESGSQLVRPNGKPSPQTNPTTLRFPNFTFHNDRACVTPPLPITCMLIWKWGEPRNLHFQQVAPPSSLRGAPRLPL